MEKQFQFQNSNIFYEVVGNGQPVVLVHGFAEDRTVWNEQKAALQDHCRLILPDLPGSGRSELLQKVNVTVDNYADCINALLQIENISNCIVLGHSMGGYVTLAFGEKYADKLKAFGLVQSTAFADSNEKKAARKKGIKLIEEHGVYPFLKNTTPNLFSKKFKEQHSEKVDGLIEYTKSFSRDALIQYYIAMMNRPDRTGVLTNSRVPVLFIIGSEDVAVPLQDILQQVHLPKLSHIHIIEGVGHMAMWEAAEEVNKHLLQFIKDVA